MAINMLERLVARIAHAPVHLHRQICGFTDQTVCPVVTHRNFVGQITSDIWLRHLIHLPSCFVNQPTDHFTICVLLNQGELNSLVGRKWLTKWLTLTCIAHAFIYTILGCANTRRCLANTVFMHKMLRKFQTTVKATQNRCIRHPNLRKGNPGVIRRHVEGPQIFFDLHARRIGWHHKTRNTNC